MYRLETRFGRDPTTVRKTKWDDRQRELRLYEPSTIFVNSMSDTFHRDVDNAQLVEMFEILAKYPKHTYIILTKRIERAVSFFENKKVPDNIWIGTSVESEKYLWRINQLRKINANTRFVSFEPLLEKIDIMTADLQGIHWVIVGGESDSKPRPMKPEFVTPIFDMCKKQGIPFFFKQWGGSTKCTCHIAWGCRLLFGKTWDELPKIKEMVV
jgi:protein gp37